jgi:hypothetical protein
MAVFPSKKAGQLLRVLCRRPLSYKRPTKSSGGSHMVLHSSAGYPSLLFAFHDKDTLPPGMVRKILCQDVGLSEEEALRLL